MCVQLGTFINPVTMIQVNQLPFIRTSVHNTKYNFCKWLRMDCKGVIQVSNIYIRWECSCSKLHKYDATLLITNIFAEDRAVSTAYSL
jgi:hypothetical protein